MCRCRWKLTISVECSPEKEKNINILLSVKLVDLSKIEEVDFKASSHESVNEEASKMSIDTFYVKWNKHLLFSNIEARNLLIIMLHTSKHFRSDYINGMMIKWFCSWSLYGDNIEILSYPKGIYA